MGCTMEDLTNIRRIHYLRRIVSAFTILLGGLVVYCAILFVKNRETAHVAVFRADDGDRSGMFDLRYLLSIATACISLLCGCLSEFSSSYTTNAKGVDLSIMEKSLSLGDSYYVDENFAKAIDVYSASLKLLPDSEALLHFRILSHRSAAFYQLEQYEKALEGAQEASQILSGMTPSSGLRQGESESCLRCEGLSALALKRYACAKAALESAVRLARLDNHRETESYKQWIRKCDEGILTALSSVAPPAGCAVTATSVVATANQKTSNPANVLTLDNASTPPAVFAASQPSEAAPTEDIDALPGIPGSSSAFEKGGNPSSVLGPESSQSSDDLVGCSARAFLATGPSAAASSVIQAAAVNPSSVLSPGTSHLSDIVVGCSPCAILETGPTVTVASGIQAAAANTNHVTFKPAQVAQMPVFGSGSQGSLHCFGDFLPDKNEGHAKWSTPPQGHYRDSDESSISQTPPRAPAKVQVSLRNNPVVFSPMIPEQTQQECNIIDDGENGGSVGSVAGSVTPPYQIKRTRAAKEINTVVTATSKRATTHTAAEKSDATSNIDAVVVYGRNHAQKNWTKKKATASGKHHVGKNLSPRHYADDDEKQNAGQEKGEVEYENEDEDKNTGQEEIGDEMVRNYQNREGNDANHIPDDNHAVSGTLSNITTLRRIGVIVQADEAFIPRSDDRRRMSNGKDLPGDDEVTTSKNTTDIRQELVQHTPSEKANDKPFGAAKATTNEGVRPTSPYDARHDELFDNKYGEATRNLRLPSTVTPKDGWDDDGKGKGAAKEKTKRSSSAADGAILQGKKAKDVAAAISGSKVAAETACTSEQGDRSLSKKRKRPSLEHYAEFQSSANNTPKKNSSLVKNVASISEKKGCKEDSKTAGDDVSKMDVKSVKPRWEQERPSAPSESRKYLGEKSPVTAVDTNDHAIALVLQQEEGRRGDGDCTIDLTSDAGVIELTDDIVDLTTASYD